MTCLQLANQTGLFFSSTTHCEPQSGCFIIQLPRRVLRVYWLGYLSRSVFQASSLVCTGLKEIKSFLRSNSRFKSISSICRTCPLLKDSQSLTNFAFHGQFFSHNMGCDQYNNTNRQAEIFTTNASISTTREVKPKPTRNLWTDKSLKHCQNRMRQIYLVQTLLMLGDNLRNLAD